MAATLTSWGTDGSLALSPGVPRPVLPSRRPAAGDRRRGLSLVPPVGASPVGAPARGIRPAASAPVRPALRPARTVASGAVHLTRAGRLAISLLVLALLAGGIMLGLAMADRPAVASAAPAAPALPTVVVRKGQTLSEIARDHLPGLAIHQGVVALQQANGLSSDRIMIGQRLVIPRG